MALLKQGLAAKKAKAQAKELEAKKLNARIKEENYRETRTRTYDPETAMLEICPKCGARPMQSCVTLTGGRTAQHVSRLEKREERRAIIYEPKNYRLIQKRRFHNRIKREKALANPSGDPNKKRAFKQKEYA